MQSQLLMGSITLALVCACVDQGPKQKQIDPAYIQKNLLAEPPAQMTNAVNADLGGKVLYLGNDVQASALEPGEEVEVVHYWKVVEPPGDQWRVFAHLVGAGPKDWANVDYSDMRTGHGPDKWQAGEIIRDAQKIRLPKAWASPFVELRVGLFPKGGHTVADRLPVVSGPADEESRVRAVRIAVAQGGGEPAASSPYVVRKAAGSITIDGRADEAAWQSVPASPAFTAAEGSPAMKGETRARLLWDDDNLYAFVSAKDTDVFNQYAKQDEPMWREDVIELFIDADRNRRGYVELQVNPNNAHFDAWFRTDRSGGTDTAWNAGMTSAVVVHGTRDERGDTDQGWEVEIAIPLAAVKGRDAAMKVAVPPTPGDSWRLNLVRIDTNQGTKGLAAASWNQITYRDFHALDRMLEVVFGDAEGKTEPAAAPAEPAGEPATESPAEPAESPAEPAGQAPGKSSGS